MKRLFLSLIYSSIFSIAATVALVLGFWLSGIYLAPLAGMGIYIFLYIVFGGVFYHIINRVDEDGIEFEVAK